MASHPRTRSGLLAAVLGAAISPSLGAQVVFDEPRAEQLGHVPEALAIGDVNGDGRPDVAVANSSADGGAGGDSVSILLAGKDGLLRRDGTYIAGKRPEGILLIHANGDDSLDVVTANFGGNSVSVLLGDGTGQLAAPSVITVPGGPRHVVAADFTGDSVLDLATANFNGDSVTVLTGNGKGGFAPLGTVAVKDGPEVLAIAHLDGDGDLDLITANANHDSVSPLSGDGKGNFSLKSAHRVGLQPRYVIARDLDGDALDDLIVANNEEHTITVEKNRGNFAFERVGTLTSAGLTRPVYLDLADIDGDGFPDILATWAGSARFTYFAAEAGHFAYAPSVAIATGRSPVGIAAADFDRDGDRDVIVTNALDDTSVLYRASVGRPTVLAFRRGDSNADGRTNLSDVIYLLTFLFRGGERPGCLEASDMNRSGTLNISDPVYLLLHLVSGGPAPPPPFGSCGFDTEPSFVSCESSPCETPGTPR